MNFVLGKQSRCQQGAFVGLGSGIAEKASTYGSREYFCETAGKLDNRLGKVDGGGMLKGVQLLYNTIVDLRVAVSAAHDRNPGKKIGVNLPGAVVDLGP